MYNELVKRLRICPDYNEGCVICPHEHDLGCRTAAMHEAADAIEALLKAASAMHTWIFLHTGDEQAAYDECGLTDEMNAELGYGGQFMVEPPKEDKP